MHFKITDRFVSLIALIAIFTLWIPIDHSVQARTGRFNPYGPPLPRVGFEENRGQFPDEVRFLARTPGANLFLTASGAVYVLGSPETDRSQTDRVPVAYSLRMMLLGANGGARSAGEDLSAQRSNYFKGTESDWRTDIRNFGRARFEEVYDGVTMIWHGLERGATRFDFVVEPNADPSRIRLGFEGAEKIEIDAGGNLLVSTPVGIIRHAKPVTYQETDGIRSEVASAFRIDGDAVLFDLGEYDRSRQLTIDPTVTLNNLAFSTLLGGFGDEFGNDIAVDQNGNTYVTGRTLSPNYPTTSGTIDTSANGLEDVFVTKLNASGSGIVFSTYLGGSFYDDGHGIAVDSLGDVYVTGIASSGFPTTAGSYDTTFNGGSDVFVARLAATGSALIFSTYIGATQSDSAGDIAIDGAGNSYIVVRTSDSIVDYPTTAGAFDTTFNGGDDVAVSKFNSTGTTLVYSTFLGGSSIDVGRSIAVNSGGEVYVGGLTTDDVTDFPTTAGAYDTTHNGATDYFVTRINAAGSGLIFSTFIGGAGLDNASGLAIDAAGNAYIGGTASAGFPTTAGVFDTTAAGSSEMAVSKISADGSALVYSTFIGNTQGETVNGLAVDNFGNAYISGNNFGGDYPTTAGAYDTTYNGSTDAVLTVLSQNASSLVYSTYLGGGGIDDAADIALDPAGNIYLTGRTTVSGAAFPTNNEAYQSFNAGGSDAFVTKFGDFSIGGKVIDAATGNPLSNVMVALSGQVAGNVLTGTDGRFGFLNTVPGEPHAVSATRAGYAINPATFNIASLANNRELIFVATVGSPTGGSGGTLRFENVSYSTTENGGGLSVKIKRLGDIQTTDPVTVDLSTVSASAMPGQDFQPISVVVSFNAAEIEKTVTIPIVNDATLEPRESFSVAITNPTNNADIEPGRGSTTVQIVDEDLANGDLLISEFRQRGRLGPHDEFVKIFNPNDFDVTIQTSDGSSGLTLAAVTNGIPAAIVQIPNLITIGARGHYLLTNNNPNGGFSLIDYPTGRGTVTAVGDRTFSADIPDNSTLAILKTADAASFITANTIDAVGFDQTGWAEGKPLSPIVPQNSEMSFVRKMTVTGPIDSGSNRSDFVLVDNRASIFGATDTSKVIAVLGAPAPENSESLRLLSPAELSISDPGFEIYDPAPVPNGKFGTLTVYRTLRNDSGSPINALRLRAAEFPTAGSQLSARYSSRPDFRLLSSPDEGESIRGVTLAAAALQPNGGGINSTLTVDSVSAANPLLPGGSIVVAIRFTVMRWGRHPLTIAAEGSW